jgi:hypothetical protein
MKRLFLLFTLAAGFLAFPSISSAQVTGNPACQVFRDTSQSFTAGLFRICSVNGEFVLDQNTAAAGNFATYTRQQLPGSGGGGGGGGGTGTTLDCSTRAGADASHKIADCIGALPTGGGVADARLLVGNQTWSSDPFAGVTKPVTLLLGPSTITTSVSTTCSTSTFHIQGSGVNLTKFVGSGLGANPVFSEGCAVNDAEISGFSINLTSSTSSRGLDFLNGQRWNVHDLNVEGGTIGVNVAGAGTSNFYRLTIEDQTTAGIQHQADSQMENKFSDISIGPYDGVTAMTAGFEIVRTVSTDVGGVYLQNIRIGRGSGNTLTDGFYFHSSAANSFFGVFGNELVADNVNVGNPYHFVNVANTRVLNSWGTASGGGSNSAVKIDGGIHQQWIGNWMTVSGTGGAFEFANNPSYLFMLGNHGDGASGYLFKMTSAATNAILRDNHAGASTLTDNYARLYSAWPSSSVAIDPPHPVGVLSNGGSGNTLSIVDAVSGKTRWIRVAASGAIEFLDNAFTAPQEHLSDDGYIKTQGSMQPGALDAGANYVSVDKGASGGTPALTISGTSTNVGLKINGKGTGVTTITNTAGDTQLDVQGPSGHPGIGIIDNFDGTHKSYLSYRLANSEKFLLGLDNTATTFFGYDNTNTRNWLEISVGDVKLQPSAGNTLLGNGSGYSAVNHLAGATANSVCLDSTIITGYNTFSLCSSLRKLKQDITSVSFSEVDRTLARLTPRWYRAKSTKIPQFGFVAEEVHDVNKDLSTYEFDPSKLVGVDFNGITAMLVREVQVMRLVIFGLAAALLLAIAGGVWVSTKLWRREAAKDGNEDGHM